MIVTLAGSNNFMLRRKLRELKEQFLSSHAGAQVEEYAGESLSAEQLQSALSGVSLFSSDRFVIIRSLSENKELSELFQQKASEVGKEVTVVLIEPSIDKRTSLYKFLKKQSDFHEMNEPTEREVISWLQAYVKDQGGVIDNNPATLLVEYVGIDQTALASEADKLVAYDKKITPQNVEKLVEKRSEASVFELLDQAFAGNKQKTLGILGELEAAHQDPFQIINMLLWQVSTLAIVHSGGEVSDQQLAKETKLNPYVIRKSRGITRRLSRSDLRHILDKASLMDERLKTTAVNPWRLLEQTILSFS